MARQDIGNDGIDSCSVGQKRRRALKVEEKMAEGARFELADELPHLRFSRPARSAAPSPLQTKPARPGAYCSFKQVRDFAVYGFPLGLVNTHSRSHVHWPTVAKSDPAANDAIHKPQSDQRNREPHEEEADPKGRDDEGPAEGHPEQPKPKRTDLPAKVRFKPRASSVAPLDVVQNDCNDRRPTGQECADHRGSANDAGQQAERM